MDKYDKVALALQSGDYWVDIQKGEVWSKRVDPAKNRIGAWKRIGTGSDSDGYYLVNPRLNGETICLRVHQLVWMVAFGPIPGGLEVDHIDSNPQNNSINNLRLLSHTDNNRAKQYSHSRKLTPEVVKEMRRAYSVGSVSERALASRFGISRAAAHDVVSGLTWSNI